MLSYEIEFLDKFYVKCDLYDIQFISFLFSSLLFKCIVVYMSVQTWLSETFYDSVKINMMLTFFLSCELCYFPNFCFSIIYIGLILSQIYTIVYNCSWMISINYENIEQQLSQKYFAPSYHNMQSASFVWGQHSIIGDNRCELSKLVWTEVALIVVTHQYSRRNLEHEW